jgi:hypothetical protein
MKKIILTLAIFIYSLTVHAFPANPSIDIDGLTVFHLNSFAEKTLTIYGHSAGALSAGICRIIIRSNDSDPAFMRVTERFKFTRSFAGLPNEEITPIVTGHALMFKLMRVDYGFENITLETKDGKSIGENISSLFGNKTVAVLAGTCYK